MSRASVSRKYSLEEGLETVRTLDMSSVDAQEVNRAARRLRGFIPRSRMLVVALIGVATSIAAVFAWLVFAHALALATSEGRSLADFLPPLFVVLLCVVVRLAFAWLQDYLALGHAAAVISSLRRSLMEKLVVVPGVVLGGAQEHTGANVAVVVDGVERIGPYFSRFFPAAVLAGLGPLVVCAFAVVLDPLSGLILIVTGPLLVVFMWLIGSLSAAQSSRAFLELRRLGGHFLETVRVLPTLRLLGAAASKRSEISEVSVRYRQATMAVLRTAFLSGFVLELIATISTAIVAVAVGLRLLEGQLSFERALMVLLLTPEFYAPLRTLGLEHHANMEASAAAARVFAILDGGEAVALSDGHGAENYTENYTDKHPRGNPEYTEHSEQPEHGMTAANSLPSGGVQEPNSAFGSRFLKPLTLGFEHVCFAYPSREDARSVEKPVLDEVNLCCSPGTVTAIIGVSGAGKTTLGHLALGLLKPTSGSITVNGLMLDELPVETWRECISAVLQEPHFFFATIAENLRFVREDASLRDLERCCAQVGALDFIRKLDKGFETRIGEDAEMLSGGERVRLAIARALLKDAPLLVLDEPTNHLDRENEMLVLECLAALGPERTVLLIAHRPLTACFADRVAVLEDGQITRCDAPEALIDTGQLKLPMGWTLERLQEAKALLRANIANRAGGRR